MKTILLVIQIILALILTGIILIQAKGHGLGSTFGSSRSSSFTRRGLDKIVFKATFFLTALFLVISVMQLIY